MNKLTEAHTSELHDAIRLVLEGATVERLDEFGTWLPVTMACVVLANRLHHNVPMDGDCVCSPLRVVPAPRALVRFHTCRSTQGNWLHLTPRRYDCDTHYIDIDVNDLKPIAGAQ